MDTLDKRIYRLPGSGVVAGVCAGLASFFQIDISLMRLIFIFLAFMGSLGIYIYIILWLILPQKSDTIEVTETKSNVNQKKLLGLIVTTVGLIALINEITPNFIRWDLIWPTVLILVGILIIFRE